MLALKRMHFLLTFLTVCRYLSPFLIYTSHCGSVWQHRQDQVLVIVTSCTYTKTVEKRNSCACNTFYPSPLRLQLEADQYKQ